MTLEKYNHTKIIIYSRDEMKQWNMAKKFPNASIICFFIGDVRDKERLYCTLAGVYYVVPAAAMKLIDACIDTDAKRLVALSTDKVSQPVNLYGAAKLCSDRIFIAADSYTCGKTKFSVVRYGNVMESRGSVIPFFMEAAKSCRLTITDKRMTRFMISPEDGVKLVWHKGGEIYVKKCPSMNICNIAYLEHFKILPQI